MNNQFNPENKKTHLVYIKRNDKTYVYEGYSYYDKETKTNKNKRKYLGILNDETGEIAPKTKTIESFIPVKNDVSYGAYYVLNHITTKFNLYEILKSVFDDKANDILTLAFAIACEGSSLYLLSNWQETNYNTYTDKLLTSPRISELLPTITFNKINLFFEKWINSIKDNEYLAYDITSISSYSKKIESVELGYNRDRENLPQINLGVLYGETTGLPVYYQIFNGSIKDVQTIKNLIVALQDMNVNNLKFVMDKGFYSSVNNAYLYDNNYTFAIAVPFTGKWAKSVLDNNKDVNDPEYYSIKHNCYFKKIEYYQDNRKLNVHIFFDTMRKSVEEMEYNTKIQYAKQTLEKVKLHQETNGTIKYTDEEILNIIKEYSIYYDIKSYEIESIDNKGDNKKCKTIEYIINKINIQNAMKTKGYLLILTNDYEKTSEEILTLYRNKEAVENAFDDIKNELDLSRLKVHSNEAVEGKIFLVFLSLIFTSYIRNMIKKANLKKDLTYKEVIKELKKIKLYTYNNGSKTTSIISSLQKKILDAFSIKENDIKAITESK